MKIGKLVAAMLVIIVIGTMGVYALRGAGEIIPAMDKFPASGINHTGSPMVLRNITMEDGALGSTSFACFDGNGNLFAKATSCV